MLIGKRLFFFLQFLILWEDCLQKNPVELLFSDWSYNSAAISYSLSYCWISKGPPTATGWFLGLDISNLVVVGKLKKYLPWFFLSGYEALIHENFPVSQVRKENQISASLAELGNP